MKKIISFVGLFAVLGVGIGDAHGVAMSAQVRRLLQEKQEKIEQLEKCEGKKQGWMIAGISTIGLTAVGVGVNIAQASKSNRLSDEIEMEKSTLERHQDELNRIQNDIAAEQLRQRREDCKKQSGKRWNENGYCEDVPGTGGGNGATVQVIEPTPMPALDNPDGEIGKPCGDNGGGIWTEKTDGTKKCSNVNGLVLCECVKGTTTTPSGGMGSVSSTSTENSSSSGGGQVVNPVKPEQETSLQKCLRERKDDRVGTACCYLSKSVAAYENGQCVCAGGKEFSIGSDGHGKCSGTSGKKDDKKPAGQCIKTHEEYLDVGCVCESGKGLIPVLDDMSGKRYCGCGMSSTWDGQKCVGKKDEQKPAEKPVTLDASVDGTSLGFYDIDGGFKHDGNCSVSTAGEWCVVFPKYTVKGKAVCNSTTGTRAVAISSEQRQSGGKECWCKMTSPKESSWVFRDTYDDSADCAGGCADRCAGAVGYNAGFRGVVFESAK